MAEGEGIVKLAHYFTADTTEKAARMQETISSWVEVCMAHTPVASEV